MGVVVRVLMLGIGGDALVTLRLLKIDGSGGQGLDARDRGAMP